jgi:hypothetical protein
VLVNPETFSCALAKICTVIENLPKEKLLMEGDFIASPASNLPTIINPFTIRNFHENLQRLKLDVERIAPVHGRVVVTMEEMRKALQKAE